MEERNFGARPRSWSAKNLSSVLDAMAAKVGEKRGTNMHNSYLSLIVGSGAIGTFIFTIGVVVCMTEGLKVVTRKVPGSVPAVAAFVTGLINSNSLSFFGEDWRSASFVFFCLWSLIAYSCFQVSIARHSGERR